MIDCEPWQGTLSVKGYALTRRLGRNLLVHRLVYEVVHGRIPDGGQVHHICENKRCVNPSHLVLLRSNAEHKRLHRQPRCRKGLHVMSGRNRQNNPSRKGSICRECRKEWQRSYRRKKEAVAYAS